MRKSNTEKAAYTLCGLVSVLWVTVLLQCVWTGLNSYTKLYAEPFALFVYTALYLIFFLMRFICNFQITKWFVGVQRFEQSRSFCLFSTIHIQNVCRPYGLRSYSVFLLIHSLFCLSVALIFSTQEMHWVLCSSSIEINNAKAEWNSNSPLFFHLLLPLLFLYSSLSLQLCVFPTSYYPILFSSLFLA